MNPLRIRHTLYPALIPYQSGALPLDELHVMYWEQSGNPHGVPVLFLHGGPGSGANADHRRFFDPRHYRIIIYDQRGAGRSHPLGEIRDNTTAHLVTDIERLRAHLGIARWIVFGGSWGSTLALAYAQQHPDPVLALVLRGIFLGRPAEVDFFLYGMRHFFPEAWAAFAGHVPPGERHDLLGAYYRYLTDPDPEVHLPAARRWGAYEGACSRLIPDPATVDYYEAEGVALGLARIEAHYFTHGLFLPEPGLLAGVERLRAIPASIIQGRYDVVCPVATAYDLHCAWPEADYQVVPDAGHSAWETGITGALVATMERLKAEIPPSGVV